MDNSSVMENVPCSTFDPKNLLLTYLFLTTQRHYSELSYIATLSVKVNGLKLGNARFARNSSIFQTITFTMIGIIDSSYIELKLGKSSELLKKNAEGWNVLLYGIAIM